MRPGERTFRGGYGRRAGGVVTPGKRGGPVARGGAERGRGRGEEGRAAGCGERRRTPFFRAGGGGSGPGGRETAGDLPVPQGSVHRVNLDFFKGLLWMGRFCINLGGETPGGGSKGGAPVLQLGKNRRGRRGEEDDHRLEAGPRGGGMDRSRGRKEVGRGAAAQEGEKARGREGGGEEDKRVLG